MINKNIAIKIELNNYLLVTKKIKMIFTNFILTDSTKYIIKHMLWINCNCCHFIM